MKAFQGFEDAKKSANYVAGEKLPAGGYVCSVIGVKYENGQNGNSDFIKLQIDVAEGEYKDFFMNQYKNNTQEDKKYKGMVSISVPKDDGSEKDGWSKNTFAKWTTAFEASNNGYTWDWDESKWKGKSIGLIFREVGNVINGREVKYTEVSAPCSVEQVKNNSFWDGYLKFKAKNGYTGNGNTAPVNNPANGFVNVPDGIDEDEIPFS